MWCGLSLGHREGHEFSPAEDANSALAGELLAGVRGESWEEDYGGEPVVLVEDVERVVRRVLGLPALPAPVREPVVEVPAVTPFVREDFGLEAGL